jgi:hypothetical protein
VLICKCRCRCGSPAGDVSCRTTAASSCCTGTCTCPPRGPTRVVAWSASQARIWVAARSCAASYAAEMLGCSSAAKDHDFDPVDDYCDESNRLPVTTQPPSRYAGHPVEAGHPAPLPIGQLGTCEASTEGIECHNADPDAQPQAWCY